MEWNSQESTTGPRLGLEVLGPSALWVWNYSLTRNQWVVTHRLSRKSAGRGIRAGSDSPAPGPFSFVAATPRTIEVTRGLHDRAEESADAIRDCHRESAPNCYAQRADGGPSASSACREPPQNRQERD